MPGELTAARIRRIHDLSSTLELPRNFFFGVREDPARLPLNVLLFARLHRQHVVPHGSTWFHHHRFVLSFNLETAATIVLDGTKHPFRPGECLLIHPYQAHRYTELAADRLCWIFATFELADKGWLEGSKNRPGPIPPACLGWMETMIRFWQARRERACQLPYLTALVLHDLVASMAGSAAPGPVVPPPAEPATAGPLPDGALIPRIHQLYEQGQRNARVKDFARLLGLSESHLRSRFRRQTGQKVGAYIREMRINRAASMLVDGSLGVSEISQQCGFESPSTFSRAFHRATGMSPREYRRQFWPGPAGRQRMITPAG